MDLATQTQRYFSAAKEVFIETFWPSRCALCDQPGEFLCTKCRQELPYIDHWRRCSCCGAPFGNIQCSECNPVMLKSLGIDNLPFSACVSVLEFDEKVARLVSTYKDKNEQGLAAIIANMMYEVIPPSWLRDSLNRHISFIPASAKAYRRRGFDHAEELAKSLSLATAFPLIPLFERPRSKDQRVLNRSARISNMEEIFQLTCTDVPEEILLIDDVYTTGATLSSAASKLLSAGAREIRCVTFARVW